MEMPRSFSLPRRTRERINRRGIVGCFRDGIGWSRYRNDRLPESGAQQRIVLGEDPFHCIGEIMDYMPAIRYLNGSGSCLLDAFNVGGKTISRYQLDFWMGSQPSGQRLRGPIGE